MFILLCDKLCIRKHTIIMKRKDFELTKFSFQIIYLAVSFGNSMQLFPHETYNAQGLYTSTDEILI